MAKSDVVLVNPVRTPFCHYMGSMNRLNARDLSRMVLKELVEQTALDFEAVDEVIAGWAMPDFYAPNIGRIAALDAGFPEGMTGVQITTGIQALEYAVNRIKAKEGELYVVFGVECSSAVKNALPKTLDKRKLLGPRTLIDPLWELSIDAQTGEPLGTLANRLADEYSITREEQDKYAVLSHKRAFKASKKKFSTELTGGEAIEIKDKPIYDGMPSAGTVTRVVSDDGIRMGVKASNLARQEPDSRYQGESITLENSANYGDGAVAMLVMSREKAEQLGYEPIATIEDTASTGTPEGDALLAPSYALEKLLEKNNLEADDIDLLEMHESFAAQVLANQKHLAEKGYDFPIEKINVNGGAIPLGDPWAATSLRMVSALAHEMARTNTEYGAAAAMTQAGVGRAVLLKR